MTASKPPKKNAKKNAKKMVTLKDVAGAAGVTSMTVSKVLKGSGRISEATKERVLQAVADLDYIANPAARILASGRTGIVAVICGAVIEPYCAQIFHLLHAHLTEGGYDVRHIHTENEMSALIGATKTSMVDGVIVSGAHDISTRPEFLASQLAQRTVFLDTFGHENVDCVQIDLRAAVETALQWMLAKGGRRIAYCGVYHGDHFDPAGAVETRLLTYLEVMKQHGLPPEFVNSRPCAGLTQEERIALLERYFARNGRPDGLFCLLSETAMLASKALHRGSGNVSGGDVSGENAPKTLLASGDDAPFLPCFDTAISAIDHRLEEATAATWRFLKNRLDNPELPPQRAVFEARFMERNWI